MCEEEDFSLVWKFGREGGASVVLITIALGTKAVNAATTPCLRPLAKFLDPRGVSLPVTYWIGTVRRVDL